MDQATQSPKLAVGPRRLRSGEQLSGVFACIGKQIRRSAASGAPYLVVDLRDRSGALPARVFDEPHQAAAGFEPGELVEATGTIRHFRGEPQLHLDTIRAVAGDPTALLPHSYRDIDELDGFLEQLARDLNDPGLARLLEGILADEGLRGAWRRAPCAPDLHHGYCGGALEHSIAVATLAQSISEVHLRLDTDLLLAAALLHELGRAHEFSYGIDFAPTRRGRLFGHAQLGAALIAQRSEGVLSSERRDALVHCVLVAGADPCSEHHHPTNGRAPLPEAIALRRLCALDAEVKAAVEQLPGGPDLIKTSFGQPSDGEQVRTPCPTPTEA
jgi:3'-5' exoribonuclease